MNTKRLVVVPSDRITAYEKAGYDWLERYYNPQGMFAEVYALSPLETGERIAYGMTIRGVARHGFRNAVRDLKPDLIRAYGGYWPADLVCENRIPGIPIIVSVHDTNPQLLHRSVQYADLVICMSKVVAQKVIKIGTDPQRIRILPNRVDFGVFQPISAGTQREALARQFPNGKYILHVGRKSEQKNLETQIRALSLLPAEYTCIFIGLGDASPYQALAKQLGVTERCHWIESVANSELPLWFSWCDCMCTPSRWEGFGIVFIEAAACGAVIVTSDIAPMNEYLKHGISALLVKDYENPQALARSIQQACEDQELRRTLSRGAIEAARPFDRHVVDTTEVAINQEALAMPARLLSFREKFQLWLRTASRYRHG